MIEEMHGIDKAFSFEPAEVQVEASFVFFRNREYLLSILRLVDELTWKEGVRVE
ncbi:hypothetical protein [Emergencia timonensis]|uniref:hypothetical protein n=1 Tax=Emergencia timonensis TaxID=1776384 RepID=UPI001A9A5131|nr:hypothetical protein [Emergencia timonensis]